MLAAHLLALASLFATTAALDRDTDGDGLSDFHEVHKHRTDPKLADSDGDGVPDGDWHERREFTYTVRTVTEVLRPVTPDSITDDFQDARVLRETDDRVQLEVLHYPFSTAAEALRDGPVPSEEDAVPVDRARWVAPGPTSDHDAGLREAIHKGLASAGIDATNLEDPTTVAQVATWLCQHADYHDGFTTFVTGFDDEGAPFIPEDLQPHLDGNAEATWPREISARGMFERGERGSCTSSAIYLSGCLRALGVPTRTMLIVPLFDAGDEREWAMARERIQEPSVRRTVLGAIHRLRNSWASHTMNEVYLRGRWWRLDYGDLGVGILRRDRYGLTTRVATLHDWADARAWETIGRRQTLRQRDAVLDGNNPYSM
ncbi:MAG: transglutaminase domain-containing protein, partial [Planctomycetota bacterium]